MEVTDPAERASARARMPKRASAVTRRAQKQRRRVLLTRVLTPVLSLACLTAVVAWASRQPSPRLPSGTGELVLIVAAVGLYAVVVSLRAERWHSILAASAVASGRRETYSLTAVGYMGNNVLPARGGELLKLWLLSRETPVARRRLLGTVLAERALDVIAVGLLFAVAAASGLSRLPALVSVTPGGLGAIVLAVALVLRLRPGAILARSVRARAIAEALSPMLAAVADLRSRRGLRLLALSVGLWTLEALVYLVVARGVSVHIGWASCVYVMCFSNLVGMVPAGPGYVGTFDSAVLVALRVAGVVGGSAVAVLLMLRFVLFVPITLLGLALLVLRHGGWSEYRLGRAARAGARPLEEPA